MPRKQSVVHAASGRSSCGPMDLIKVWSLGKWLCWIWWQTTTTSTYSEARAIIIMKHRLKKKKSWTDQHSLQQSDAATLKNKPLSSHHTQDTASCKHPCIASACRTSLTAHMIQAFRLQTTSCSSALLIRNPKSSPGCRELHRKTKLWGAKHYSPKDCTIYQNLEVWLEPWNAEEKAVLL